MITAIISSIRGLGEEYEDYGSVRGNGKNVLETFALYEDYENGRKIFTNYYTTFSEQMSFQNIIQYLKDNPKEFQSRGVSFGISEIQTAFNSIGNSKAVTMLVSTVAAQTRKLNCDMYYDLQILWEAGNRLRNQTDVILRPIKLHADGTICLKDSCEEEHWVIAHSIKPPKPYNILRDEKGNEMAINCQEIGKLYDTNELIFDEIIIPTKKNSKKVCEED